jgi:phospholipid/cholesterol/gamma-HCH transport system substrate-binding protein
MTKENNSNLQLGVLILLGTTLLIMALYMIGSKQDLFGSTIKISAQFYNVSGLMKGNNVRFGGIDIGTVESVEIITDSSVNVVMVINKDIHRFIKKNAVASVGTDGLMGNRLVNINAGKGLASVIEEGDILQTLKPVQMDEMVRTLDVTNENIRVISSNLKNITEKINSKNSFWNLLMDTVVAENVKSAVVSIKVASNQSAIITGNLKNITEGIQNGKGSLGALITDTTLSSRVNQVVVKLEKLSDTAAVITGDISIITDGLKNGQGSVGTLLSDTTFLNNLNQSMENIKQGSQGFNENMEALKHNFLLRKYFRKKERK